MPRTSTAKSHKAAYPGTQAIRRALTLLKCFAEDQPELGLTEISRKAGIHKATAYRIMSALEAEGLLTRNKGTEKYRLGPEAIALGGRALRQHSLRAAALPELKRLAEETGETANLDVLIDQDVMIVEEIPGSHLLAPSQSIGTRWPAYATSTGKAIFAAMPENERDDWLRQPRKTLTEKTVVDRAELTNELVRARRMGYAPAVEELELGYVAVGAAVVDRLGWPVGAISIGGASPRFPPRRISELGAMVRDAATRVSSSLGGLVRETGSNG